MSKKVSIGPKPQPKQASSAEEWVESGSATVTKPTEAEKPTETTKRLTIDLPASLHTRVKVACALRGVKMVDAIRELLEEKFPEQQQTPDPH